MTDTTVTPTPTNTPTPIHTPTPTNTPVPTLPSEVEIELKVTRSDGGVYKVGGEQIHLYEFGWKVLDSITVQLKVTGPSGFDPTGYAFQASSPKSTGLQNGDSDDADCDWDLFEADPEYHIYTTASISNNGAWDFVRCGLGEPSTRLTVTATAPDGTSIPPNVNLPIPEAWHQEDKQINYRICQITDEPTTRPNYAKALGFAVDGWETVYYGVGFRQINPARCDETLQGIEPVTLHTVSPAVTKKQCLGGIGDPNHILGCARATRGTTSDHPHLGPQTIFTRSNLEQLELYWTSLTDLVERDSYRYLPGHLMYELGHTAGLGHSAGLETRVMGQGAKETQLNINEISAMEAIYANH